MSASDSEGSLSSNPWSENPGAGQRYGFSQSPNVPLALTALKEGFDPMAACYFLSRQTVVPSRRPGLALWREDLFSAMVRISQSPMSYFRLPVNRVVELGSQVEI
jgi:KUP system potassium uptake protein